MLVARISADTQSPSTKRNAAHFLGPRQLPIRVKDALATVMLIIECKQLDRSNCQPIDIIIKEWIDTNGSRDPRAS